MDGEPVLGEATSTAAGLVLRQSSEVILARAKRILPVGLSTEVCEELIAVDCQLTLDRFVQRRNSRIDEKP